MFCTSCDGRNVGLPICEISLKVNWGKSAIAGHVWNSWEAAGEIQQLLTGLVRIDLLTLRIDPVVPQPELVGEIVTEQVSPTGGETAIGVVFVAAEEPAAVAAGGVKWSRNQAGLVFVAETEEAVVLLRIFLIDANVEIVSGLGAYRIRQIIESVAVYIGCRDKVSR